ncbi:MAG TPA: hypothetical protein VI942_04240 [Thermoanaerobaculia bacterium]|nr:hypothetical protein [Thermoanaerobaculia bacterium]
MRPARRAALGAVLLLAGAAAACGRSGPPPKAPMTALWIGSESAPLANSGLAGLESAGVHELFYEAAALDWSSGSPRLVERFGAPLPRATASTLVVRGPWRRPVERPRAIAGAWRRELESLELAAERRRATPIGIHFALDTTDALDELAKTIRALRGELGARFHLSAELDPSQLADEGAESLARATDYLVVFVYGQPPNEPEEDSKWDLDAARATIAALDRLGRPYTLGAWTLGAAQRRSATGEIVGSAADLAVGALLREPRLEPMPGAVFGGLGRQAIERVARHPARFGDWILAQGESIRVVRPTTAHLERFLAVAAPRPGSPRLGAVLRRLRAPGETLALSADNLAAALAPGEAAPAFAVQLERLPGGHGTSRFRLTLANGNDEPTDYGAVESNYVELRLPRGVLADVDAGGFDGWEQLWHGSERRTLKALREADTLRLYAAYVDGGERIASGPVAVRGAGELERVTISGTFILPGGRELALAPREVAIEGAEP